MNTVLALLAITLLYLLQKVLYGRYWDKGLDIRLSFSENHAREGERLNLYETITNRKAMPLPVVKVKFEASRELIFDDTTNTNISDHFYRNDILSCLMYQKIRRTLGFKCGKRGYYTIDRVDAVGSDLFLSTNFVSVLPMQLTLSVYPKLLTDKQFDIIYTTMLGNTLTRRLINEDPFEFRGIREYQPFDPMKSVNYKASAKTGELKVNQHAPTSDESVHILLNLEQETIWQFTDLLEESIRLASTIAYEYLGNGVPVSFTTNGLDIINKKPSKIADGSGSSHEISINEALARIDTKLTVPSFIPFLEEIVENRTGSDTLVLISSFQRNDFFDAMRTLKEENIPFFWIVPLHDDMEFDAPDDLKADIFRYHVAKSM